MRACVVALLAIPVALGTAIVSCVGDAGTTVNGVTNDGGSGTDGAPADATGQVDAAATDSGNGGGDGGTTDAGPAACDVTKPFGAPSSTIFSLVNRTKVNDTTLGQYAPRLSADELTVYYAEYPGEVGPDIAPAADVFVATRDKLGDTFKPGVTLSSIDTQDLQDGPSISADGLTIYYATDYINGALCTNHARCIARASRAQITGSFAEAGVAIDNAGSQATPYVVGNGPDIYYTLDVAGLTAGDDISTNAGSTLLTNVNSAADESFPAVTPDGLTIYFASTRPTDGGTDEDIWMATRSSATDPFGAPVRVDALSSPTDDAPGFISADGCRIYFTRDDGANGGLNLYYAERGK